MVPEPTGKLTASIVPRRCPEEALDEMFRPRSFAGKCRCWFDQAQKSTTQPPPRVRRVSCMSFPVLGLHRMTPLTPRQTLTPSPLNAAPLLGLAMTSQETSETEGQEHHFCICHKERSTKFLWTEPKVCTCRILSSMSEVGIENVIRRYSARYVKKCTTIYHGLSKATHMPKTFTPTYSQAH